MVFGSGTVGEHYIVGPANLPHGSYAPWAHAHWVWLKNDRVNEADIPIRGEADEGIFNLSLSLTESITTRHNRQQGPALPTVRQEAKEWERYRGEEGVSQKVDEIIELCTIKGRDTLPYLESAGEEAVAAVDADRDQIQEKKALCITLNERKEREKVER